jgi:hypothetical protein
MTSLPVLRQGMTAAVAGVPMSAYGDGAGAAPSPSGPRYGFVPPSPVKM